MECTLAEALNGCLMNLPVLETILLGLMTMGVLMLAVLFVKEVFL